MCRSSFGMARDSISAMAAAVTGVVDGRLLLRGRRRRLRGGGGRRRGGRGVGDLVDLFGERGELLLLRVRGLAQRGDRLLQLLALGIAERGERDGGRRGGVGARVLLDDLRERLAALVVLAGGDFLPRLLQQRRGLHVVRHGENEVDDDGGEHRGEERGDDEETANAHDENVESENVPVWSAPAVPAL